MITDFRPNRPEPKLVSEPSEASEHPLDSRASTRRFMAVYLLVAFSLMGMVGYKIYQNVLVKRVEREKMELLALKVKNLEIFTDLKSKMLRLEQVLFENRAFRERLGAQIPEFSAKILSLDTQHRDTGITAALILGLVEVESGFNPKAVSSAGARGLTQCMPGTAAPYLRQMGYPVNDTILFQPEISLEVGTAVLKDLHLSYMNRGIESKDEFTFTLLAYNKGEKAVSDASTNKELRMVYLDYAMKVKAASKRWSDLGF